MIIISFQEDIQKIPDKQIVPYIQAMLDDLLKICFPDRSIESVGEIFFLENPEDLKSFFNKVLSSPIKEERFEWIESVDREYSNGCVVLNNEKAINIIGRTNFFKEVFQQQRDISDKARSMRKHSGFRIEQNISDSKREVFNKRTLCVGKPERFPHRYNCRFFRQKVVFQAVFFRQTKMRMK